MLVLIQEWVGPQIVDNILEDIRLMMEVNLPKYNQRRISTVKFLAELYNYRLVDSSVIIQVPIILNDRIHKYLVYNNFKAP